MRLRREPPIGVTPSGFLLDLQELHELLVLRYSVVRGDDIVEHAYAVPLRDVKTGVVEQERKVTDPVGDCADA